MLIAHLWKNAIFYVPRASSSPCMLSSCRCNVGSRRICTHWCASLARWRSVLQPIRQCHSSVVSTVMIDRRLQRSSFNNEVTRTFHSSGLRPLQLQSYYSVAGFEVFCWPRPRQRPAWAAAATAVATATAVAVHICFRMSNCLLCLNRQVHRWLLLHDRKRRELTAERAQVIVGSNILHQNTRDPSFYRICVYSRAAHLCLFALSTSEAE